MGAYKIGRTLWLLWKTFQPADLTICWTRWWNRTDTQTNVCGRKGDDHGGQGNNDADGRQHCEFLELLDQATGYVFSYIST